jgi:hypothetical protein
MALHLLKLCVGVHSLDQLEEISARRAAEARAAGRDPVMSTHTRMLPKRLSELRDGGSLYWVIRGQVLARQPLIDIVQHAEGDGTRCCRILMRPEVIAVRPRPCRAFQGWRYLEPNDAPPDWVLDSGSAAAPPEMRRELMELCLI